MALPKLGVTLRTRNAEELGHSLLRCWNYTPSLFTLCPKLAIWAAVRWKKRDELFRGVFCPGWLEAERKGND